MARPVMLASLMVLALLGAGCRGEGKSTTAKGSAEARALCEREVQTNEPRALRGRLLGAFDTTIKAVNPEIRRVYKKHEKDGRLPRLASQPEDEPLALCYYDVTAEQQVQPEVERVGIVVDQRLNSFLLYAGTKKDVPVQAIG